MRVRIRRGSRRVWEAAPHANAVADRCGDRRMCSSPTPHHRNLSHAILSALSRHPERSEGSVSPSFCGTSRDGSTDPSAFGLRMTGGGAWFAVPVCPLSPAEPDVSPVKVEPHRWRRSSKKTWSLNGSTSFLHFDAVSAQAAASVSAAPTRCSAKKSVMLPSTMAVTSGWSE